MRKTITSLSTAILLILNTISLNSNAIESNSEITIKNQIITFLDEDVEAILYRKDNNSNSSINNSTNIPDTSSTEPNTSSTTDRYSNAPEDWAWVSDPANPGNKILINKVSNLQYKVAISSEESELIAYTTIAALIAFTNDRELSDFVQDHKGFAGKPVRTFAEAFGSKIPFVTMGLGYVIGVVTENDEVKSFVKIAVESAVITNLITTAIKRSTNRARPEMSEDPYTSSQTNNILDSSFPSAHTANAFSFATIIAEKSKNESVLIPILAYTAATLTAWERIYDNKHWTSDVIIGGLIGHLVAKSVLNKEHSNQHILFTPYASQTSTGFMIQYQNGNYGPRRPCGEGLTGDAKIHACISKALNN